MLDEISQEDVRPVKDGIETCEDRCSCGGSLRLHAYTFDRYTDSRKQRYYVDCDKQCGKVGPWADTLDEAVEAFDAMPGIQGNVQEA